MAVNWADELGIDMEILKTEHPLHPEQLHMKKKLTRQAVEYWSRERYLAQLGKGLPETPYESHTAETLAKEFGVRSNTIYRWIKRGYLPKREKNEFFIRITRDEIEEVRQRFQFTNAAGETIIKSHDFTQDHLDAARRLLDGREAV